MNMKVKVTTVEEIELDVSFPAYRRSPVHFYKIVSDEKAIQVVCAPLVETFRVETCSINLAYDATEECTADEFNEAYKQTLEKLTKLAQA